MHKGRFYPQHARTWLSAGCVPPFFAPKSFLCELTLLGFPSSFVDAEGESTATDDLFPDPALVWSIESTEPGVVYDGTLTQRIPISGKMVVFLLTLSLTGGILEASTQPIYEGWSWFPSFSPQPWNVDSWTGPPLDNPVIELSCQPKQYY